MSDELERAIPELSPDALSTLRGSMTITRMIGAAIGAACLAFTPVARAQEPGSDGTMLSLDSLLNTKVSSAAKYAQTSRQAAASVTIVTQEEISRYGYRTLADLLAGVRGFYLTNDRTVRGLGTRGFSPPSDFNNRFVLLIDGHTVNDDLWGQAPIDAQLAFDMATLERVEVIRGPGAALYGTGAVFAVINLVTKTGKAIDGVQVASSVGSFGRHGASVLAGGTGGHLDYMVSGLWEESQGQDLFFPEFAAPETNYGVAQRLDWEHRYGFVGKARLGALTAAGRFGSRSSGLPAAGWGGAFNDPRGRRYDASGSAEVRYDGDVTPRQSLMVRAYFDRYRATGLYPNPAGFDVHDYNAADAWGTEVAWGWDAASYSRLTIGAEFRDRIRAEEAIGGFPGAPAYVMQDGGSVFSLYAQEQVELSRRVSVLGGIRTDFHSSMGTAAVPRAAVVYDAGRGATLKLLYGEAVRVPSVIEAHLHDGAYKAGPALEPERIRTLEAVWDQRFSSWLHGSVSAFAYESENLIQSVLDPSDFLLFFENVGQVRTRGAELELVSRMRNGFQSYGSFELAYARDELTGQRLVNSPVYLLKLGASQPVSGLNLASELRREAGRRTLGGAETDPFVVANVAISGHPRLGGLKPLGAAGERIEFTFKIENLFNATYHVPGGPQYRQDSFAQNGRTMWAQLGYGF